MKQKVIHRPSWDEYFMAIAYLTATRSSCLHLNTGVVITKNKRIISTGYNGAPTGIKSSLEHGFCNKEKHGIDFHTKGSGLCRGLHAEINAMNQTSMEALKESTMYTLYHPCTPCAKSIIGNNIKKVIYSKIYKEEDSLAKELFNEKGVKVIQMDLDIDKIYNKLINLK